MNIPSNFTDIFLTGYAQDFCTGYFFRDVYFYKSYYWLIKDVALTELIFAHILCRL